MRVSAVVCTRNRSDLLSDCLEALSHNVDEDTEILVVDQSTDDATAEIVKSKSAADRRIRHIPTDTVGLSRARNLAIRESEGEIVSFTDDDCIPSSIWVTSIRRTFDAMPEVGALYGRSLPYNQVWPGERPVALKQETAPRLFKGRQNPWKLGHGCNMSFRREVFDTVGQFDEALGPGGDLRNGDDADFTYRMLCAGVTAYYDPNVVVYHKQFRHGSELWKLERDYGIGAGAFLAKHLRHGDLYALKLIFDRWWTAGALHIMYGLLTCKRTHLRLGVYRILYSAMGMWLARNRQVSETNRVFDTGG